ncbi:MAG TPA: hypothetical protein VHZ03_31930 [Trebonia sp.]|jgi:hypothetical protein|nr:hypothetical protein [Trebonia sp.]
MIIIILLAFVVALALLKGLGMWAQRMVYIEVHGLTLEQVIDIGTKASESAFRRLRGRAKVFNFRDGSVGWNARCAGGAITYIVTPLEDGSGFRVGAAALAQKAIKMYGVADLSTDYGRTKFFLYRIMWAMGIPHNPRALLWRRWRGLNAIKRRGTPIQAAPQAAPVPAPLPAPNGSYPSQQPSPSQPSQNWP